MIRTLPLLRCLTPLLILLSAGCGESGSSEPESTAVSQSSDRTLSKDDHGASQAPLKVVATFSILGDWLQEIGGDDLEVITLVGPDGDAHTFEPTPRDAAQIADADCVFELGLGFETWLDSMMSGTQSDAVRICVSDSITPRVLSESEGHAETDPHVWHDPVLVISIVRSIEKCCAGFGWKSSRTFDRERIVMLPDSKVCIPRWRKWFVRFRRNVEFSSRRMTLSATLQIASDFACPVFWGLFPVSQLIRQQSVWLRSFARFGPRVFLQCLQRTS